MTWALRPHGVRTRGKKSVFRGCTALQHLDLGEKGQGSTNLNRSLPDCCFLEAGVVALYLPSDFNRIGTAACVSCQQLRIVICPKRMSLRFWVQPLHTAHSSSNSAFPETFASLSKKPFLSAPRCKKSAPHHPCFTLLGELLQAVRSFEQFVNKGKAKRGEVHMPDSMPLTNASNWTSPNGSDSCRQMPMTNGKTHMLSRQSK